MKKDLKAEQATLDGCSQHAKKSDIRRIERSRYFSQQWYDSQYPEYKLTGYCAAEHYLLLGWKEGKNPSEKFSTSEYLERFTDVAVSDANPLWHYEKYGRRENRMDELVPRAKGILNKLIAFACNSNFKQRNTIILADFLNSTDSHPVDNFSLFEYLQQFVGQGHEFYYLINAKNPNCADLKAKYGVRTISFCNIPIYRYVRKEDKHSSKLPKLPPSNTLNIQELFAADKPTISDCAIDIVIPVYNGLEYLPNLFDSIQHNTDLDYHLFVVNDASSDPKVYPFLCEVQARLGEKMTLLNNEGNLGFIKSVNKALVQTKNHLALINTDVILPKNWASKLFRPLLFGRKIASVTPFSNDATVFSLPTIGSNPDFNGDINKISEALANINLAPQQVELWTGVGFCMAMNQDAIKEIGLFNEQFGKGYCEENDWCLRTLKMGYSHTIAADLFVWHKHGGSFLSKEKQKLVKANSKLLAKLHPDVRQRINKFGRNQNFFSLRFFAELLYLSTEAEKTLLWFDHLWGGGAQSYTFNQIRENPNHLFVRILSKQEDQIQIHYHYQGKSNEIMLAHFDDLWCLLAHLHHDEIVINNMAGYPDQTEILRKVAELKQKSQAKVIFKAHDFQAICPNVTMLIQDEKHCYCKDLKQCHSCPSSTSEAIHVASVQQWHESWGHFFEHTLDEAIAFSENTKAIFSQLYPQLADKFSLIPHRITPLRPVHIKKHKQINIAILGSIGDHKGSKFVGEMIELLDSYPQVTIQIIGIINKPYKHRRFKVLGPYKTPDLPKIFEKRLIDIVFIPSILPETFSYTTSEAMSAELPVACFNIGAPVERVSQYSKGLVIDEINAKTALNQITQFIASLRQ